MNANEREYEEKAKGKRQKAKAGENSSLNAQRSTLNAQPLFARVAIVGVGLMGGSLGMALRAKGLAQTVVGVDTSERVLARAREIGAIDEAAIDLQKGVADADCVIVAAPVPAIPFLLETLVPVVPSDALITDIGSVKRWIVETGERCFGNRFVGGHPMAGAPAGGIDAARADVFTGAAWGIVGKETPDLNANHWVAKLAAMAQALEARPVLLDSAQHDRLVALVSHLPHALSFAFADMIAAQPDAEQALQMAGSSFRDLTRVAVADRAFWQAIFQANRQEALTAIAEYETRLQALRRTLE